MAKRVIRIGLSSSSVASAKIALLQYKQDLKRRCEQFLIELADRGIEAAWAKIGPSDEGFGKYITFQKNISNLGTSVECILVATNTGIITNEWYQADGTTKTADVSPILMLEFGAGTIAGNPDAGKFGMGEGTFPGQTHAHDANGWWYKSKKDDTWYHSYGFKAPMPVQGAVNAMISDANQIAKKVFG